jgi:hypothetical protein
VMGLVAWARVAVARRMDVMRGLSICLQLY